MIAHSRRRHHAVKGNAFKRYGFQGDRRGTGAYRAAPPREARDSGKARQSRDAKWALNVSAF